MNIRELPLKRGDTLNINCSVVGEDNLPMDLTGYTISCHVRAEFGKLVQKLTIIETDLPEGEYTLWTDAEKTALWPLGLLYSDIEYIMPGGRVVSTETFHVRVFKDWTYED